VIVDQDLVAARLAAHGVGVVGKAHRRLVGVVITGHDQAAGIIDADVDLDRGALRVCRG
jgi:hypothetical protein